MTTASVPQHARKVPLKHITHQLEELSCTGLIRQGRLWAFCADQSPANASVVLMLFANRTSKTQLNPLLRSRQSEVPQSGLTLSSMNLLSSILNFQHDVLYDINMIYKYIYILLRTQRWFKDNRLHSELIGWASQPVADWKCLHFYLGCFHLALNSVLFLYWLYLLCFVISIFFFSSVCICSDKEQMSCHQHWSEWYTERL